MVKQSVAKFERRCLAHPNRCKKEHSAFHSLRSELYYNTKNINGNNEMDEKGIQPSYRRVLKKPDKNNEDFRGNVNPTLQIVSCASKDSRDLVNHQAVYPKSFDKLESCAGSDCSLNFTFRSHGTNDATRPLKKNSRQASTTAIDYSGISCHQKLQVDKNYKETESCPKSPIHTISPGNELGLHDNDHRLKPVKSFPKEMMLRKAISDVLSPSEVNDTMGAIFRKFPNLLNGIPPFQHVLSIAIATALYIHFVHEVRLSASQGSETRIKQVPPKCMPRSLSQKPHSCFPIELRNTDDFVGILDSQSQENKHFEHCIPSECLQAIYCPNIFSSTSTKCLCHHLTSSNSRSKS